MSKKSNGDYSVFKRYLEEAGFEVLILKIPVNEIEDKLAYLAKEKGQITKRPITNNIVTRDNKIVKPATPLPVFCFVLI